MSAPPAGLPFYPLANPKGTEFNCEVCGKPAYLQCSLCCVTYYCGTEHQKIDWVGIHERICGNLMALRKPMPFIASEDERRKARDRLMSENIEMVNLTQLTGQKLLFQGKPEEAVPAALQCLKFSAEAYGLASVELVTPYLILAEASIGLGRLCQAEAYLAQAQWTILKTQHECSNSIRSQLHRKLGLLYAAKKDYDLALENLAKDIFYASCEFGTDHVRTSGGYFQMAEVFYAIHERDSTECNEKLTRMQKQLAGPHSLAGPSAAPNIPGAPSARADNPKLDKGGACLRPNVPCLVPCLGPDQPIETPKEKIPLADSLYSRVVDIWAEFLAQIIYSLTYRPVVPDGIGAVVAEITHVAVQTLDEAQLAEAEKMLRAIHNYHHMRLVLNRGEMNLCHPLGKPDPKVRLLLVLSMLKFISEERNKAAQYLAEAKILNEFATPHDQLQAEIALMSSALEDKVKPTCVTAH